MIDCLIDIAGAVIVLLLDVCPTAKLHLSTLYLHHYVIGAVCCARASLLMPLLHKLTFDDGLILDGKITILPCVLSRWCPAMAVCTPFN